MTALDDHTAAAQHRILTLAEKSALPADASLVLIRQKLRNLIDGGACSIADKMLALLVIDLADVVAQMAAPLQPLTSGSATETTRTTAHYAARASGH